jgi:peptidase E
VSGGCCTVTAGAKEDHNGYPDMINVYPCHSFFEEFNSLHVLVKPHPSNSFPRYSSKAGESLNEGISSFRSEILTSEMLNC